MRERTFRTATNTASALNKRRSSFFPGAEYLEVFDEEHSEQEDRFFAVGPIRNGVVVIVWTERDEDTVRIISARWATAHERNLFESYLDKYL